MVGLDVTLRANGPRLGAFLGKRQRLGDGEESTELGNTAAVNWTHLKAVIIKTKLKLIARLDAQAVAYLLGNGDLPLRCHTGNRHRLTFLTERNHPYIDYLLT